MTDTAQNLLSASSARPQGLPEKFWDAEKTNRASGGADCRL